MHPRYAPFLFGLLVSGMMSFLVSCIATLRAVGPVENFAELWLSAWLPAWSVAFPAILLVGPLVRRFVHGMVRAPADQAAPSLKTDPAR
ncbi:MAG: DUF2798 domain-containing protein [Paracoccaceae bacterium]